MSFIGDFKKRFIMSEAESAEQEAYEKEAIVQARDRGKKRAKHDYKEKK